MAVYYPETLPVDGGDRRAASHAAWLRDVASLLDRLQKIVGALAGADGVVRNYATGATDYLAVAATDPVSMAVAVSPGLALVSMNPCELAARYTTPSISAPFANPRIDVVELRAADNTITIVTGVEAGSPSAPAVDTDCLKLAEIYCRPGMTCVKNSDDSTNGYITDGRIFI